MGTHLTATPLPPKRTPPAAKVPLHHPHHLHPPHRPLQQQPQVDLFTIYLDQDPLFQKVPKNLSY